nr:MAG TPA: hypothetical protein [Caudoviricetes sp.]
MLNRGRISQDVCLEFPYNYRKFHIRRGDEE